jgi:spermidine synthase
MLLTSRRTFWLVTLLFFVSGATGLAYEVIWFKRFSHIWGNSSLAIAIVVATFLLGLGVGAEVIGRLTDRLRSPLAWYGLLELAIGALATLVPLELRLVARAAGSIEAALPDGEPLRLAIRFALTLLVIGPPCLLMGGTLPLLVRQCTRRSLSDATGWLYGVNTLGAAAGCYLTGFHVLPSLGLFWTNNLAAAANLAIAAIVLLAVRGGSISTASRQVPGEGRDAGSGVVNAANRVNDNAAGLFLPAAAALIGCAALVLQMTWNRQLAVALGGSTYAFSATLLVVLVGIAAGALVYHVLLRRFVAQHNVAAIVVFLLAAGAVAGQQQLPRLCEHVALAREARSDLLGNAAICVTSSMVLELTPSLGAGVLFPLLVQLTRQAPAFAGHAVGNMYAWNTFGALVGATITARLIFPALGTAGATAVAIGLYAAAILLVLPWPDIKNCRLALSVTLAAGCCAVLAVQRPDPRLTDMGMYLYGYSPPEQRMQADVDMFREGRTSNVLVSRLGGARTLRVNGKVDAGTERDMPTQLGLAYFPRAFHPLAKDVLVLGYGSGATAGASLQFPETRVVCCEIEPAIFEASPLFEGVNHAPTKSARFQMECDDGRSYLQRIERQFEYHLRAVESLDGRRVQPFHPRVL